MLYYSIGIKEGASQIGNVYSILMYVHNPINCYQLFIHFKAYACFFLKRKLFAIFTYWCLKLLPFSANQQMTYYNRNSTLLCYVY